MSLFPWNFLALCPLAFVEALLLYLPRGCRNIGFTFFLNHHQFFYWLNQFNFHLKQIFYTILQSFESWFVSVFFMIWSIISNLLSISIVSLSLIPLPRAFPFWLRVLFFLLLPQLLMLETVGHRRKYYATLYNPFAVWISAC